MQRRYKTTIWIWATSVVLALALVVGGCALYVADYYRADLGAIEAFVAACNVTETVVADGVIAYGEADAEVGLIFYPGGKVEYSAYEPLMMALAARGVLCILVEMPFHLAVLDVNAADGLPEAFPQTDRWYIGGHSLGGSMAASYAAEHTEEYAGVVLLGAYVTADLSASSLSVLSLYGSEDTVMNREKYEKYKKNLPANLTETVLEGGCHAYFGMYGRQKGDGEPAMSAEEQICASAEHMANFMLKGER